MTLTPSQREKLKHVFRMPKLQTIASRKSSITNAFVNSLIPVIPPNEQEILESLELLGMSLDHVTCAYCGDAMTEWDHLRPLVVNRRPTGYISEIGNLVPSCGKCNQSKGNKHWETWMRSSARHSPATRQIPDLDRRIERLRDYERWKQRQPLDLESILDPEKLQVHWHHLDQIAELMADSQQFASELREAIRVQLERCHDSTAGR